MWFLFWICWNNFCFYFCDFFKYISEKCNDAIFILKFKCVEAIFGYTFVIFLGQVKNALIQVLFKYDKTIFWYLLWLMKDIHWHEISD
jgi:hypothetical protein